MAKFKRRLTLIQISARLTFNPNLKPIVKSGETQRTSNERKKEKKKIVARPDDLKISETGVLPTRVGCAGT